MFTYGPVPSRRLGRSLGVSPIPPKTCSYTCVYCQLGRTNRLQVKRESFFPRDDILAEIIKRAQETQCDYITFVGDGEPTLCADLGWLLEQTKQNTELKTAVITNGSLLWLEDVRHQLASADIVIPTLDAGDEPTFRRINRPHRQIRFDSMIQGQIDFQREFAGRLWLEVMLVSGVNDSTDELVKIRHAIEKIQPERVYILAPIRPPAESWVRPPNPDAIIEAQRIIGRAIPIAENESGGFGLQEFTDAAEALIEIGGRHPLRLEQAGTIETRFSEKGTIERMLDEGELVKVDYGGEMYLLPSRFLRGS
jgi:wyosine [tRNA(Phe)-imidazoG37] synthetase (radical SAM superfamily)